jgi:3-hydroxyacyl-CoA dehydrogenase
MRLGFNWTIGPFEILDKIGIEFFAERDQNLKLNRFLNNLYLNKRIDWYSDKQLYLKHDLRTLRRRSNIYWLKADVKKNENLIFNSAKIYTSETEGYNIVEFTTKANTLDSDSMYALSKATEKNLIIINDALQFSAGVNLNYVMEFAKQKEWRKIQKFIFDFQQTCKKLKYSEFPVIAAPSGLAIGGGFEVVCQSDYVVSHTNVVLGLVETLVGLIPAGGGCKEMLWRWMQTDESKKDLNFAPLKVFDLIGYAKTASSPNEAIPNKFLLDKDRVVINRDMLLHESEKLLLQINKDYKPPAEPTFKLSGANVRDKMYEILETLYKDKKILDHGLEVGKQLAFVLSGGNTNLDKELSEDDLYALELDAFMNLIQMPKTQERIKHTLETGKPLVN